MNRPIGKRRPGNAPRKPDVKKPGLRPVIQPAQKFSFPPEKIPRKLNPPGRKRGRNWSILRTALEQKYPEKWANKIISIALKKATKAERKKIEDAYSSLVLHQRLQARGQVPNRGIALLPLQKQEQAFKEKLEELIDGLIQRLGLEHELRTAKLQVDRRKKNQMTSQMVEKSLVRPTRKER